MSQPIWGGYFISPLRAETSLADIPIDLTDCYIFEVNPEHIISVRYTFSSYTSSATIYKTAKSYNLSPTRRIYYIEKTDNDKTVKYVEFVVKKGYGTKYAEDSSGKRYKIPVTTYPINVASKEFPTENILTIETDIIENIRTGHLKVKVTDEYKSLHYQYPTSGYVSFPSKEFTIDYDPVRENDITFYHNYSSKFIASAKLDGEDLLHGLRYYDPYFAQEWVYSGKEFIIYPGDGNHTIDITRDISTNIPVKFKFENAGGNATEEEALRKVISYVSVDGTELTNQEWLDENFSVPNYSKIAVGLKSKYFDHDLRESWQPDEKIYYFGNYPNEYAFNKHTESSFKPENDLTIRQYDASPFVITVKGAHHVPFRFTLHNNLKQDIYWSRYRSFNYSSLLKPNESAYYDNLTNWEYDYLGFNEGYGLLYLRTLSQSPSKITDNSAVFKHIDKIVVDGDTIKRGEGHSYSNYAFKLTKQDAVITPVLSEYTRQIPIRIYVDDARNSSSKLAGTLTVDAGGYTESYYELNRGWNTVFIKEDDDPFEFKLLYWTNTELSIYLNDSTEKLTQKDANGRYTELKDLAPNSVIKVYAKEPKFYTNTYVVEDGLECEILHDGNAVQPGTHKVMDGTEIKFVPTQKSDLVVTTSLGETLKADAEGNFIITPTDIPTTYTLRRRDPQMFVDCGLRPYIYVQLDGYFPVSLDVPNQQFTFSDRDADSFSCKIFDPTGAFIVTGVTATPSDGFSFDTATGIASGIKDNMVLKVTAQKNDKPLGYNIYIDPGTSSSSGESGLCVKYNNYGMTMLQKLNFGANQTTLSADAYPISIGPYDYDASNPDPTTGFPSVVLKESIPTNFKLTINGQTKYINYQNGAFSESNDPSITINEAVAVEGRALIDTDGRELSFSMDNNYYDNTPEFTYSLGLGEEVSGNNSSGFSILPTEKMTIKFTSGDPNEWIVYTAKDDAWMGEQVYAYFTNNYNGEFELQTDHDSFQSMIPEYLGVVRFKHKDMKLNFNINKPAGAENFNPVTSINGTTYTYQVEDMIEGLITYDNVAYTSDYTDRVPVTSIDKRFRIVDVHDSKRLLTYDRETGILSGLSQVLALQDVNTPELTLDIEYAGYDRYRKLNVKMDNTAWTSKQLTLASGKSVESSSQLADNAVIDFNPEDLPLNLQVFTRSGTRYTYPTVYLNGNIVERDGTSYNFPEDIADGSVLRINGTASTGSVSYEIEDGVNISILHDGQYASASEEPSVLPFGTEIKFVSENAGLSNIEIYRNGQQLTPAEITTGFKVANEEERIEIRVARYTLNVIVNGDLNPSELNIKDNQGNTYSIDSSNNSITATTDINSFSVMNMDDDYYITSATTDPKTIAFDPYTGIISNATAGTITLNAKQIVRDREANFYLHNEQLNGTRLVLGKGKIYEASHTLIQGEQTVSYGEDDLPLLITVSETGNGSDTGITGNELVYVNGEKCTFDAAEGGFLLPTDAFKSDETPLVRIYSAETEPVEVIFGIEEGIDFEAMIDNNPSLKSTTAGIVEYLPGTHVSFSASTAADDDTIVIEDEEGTIAEGKTASHSFTVGDSGMSFTIRHRKMTVTVECEELWYLIEVSDETGGYAMSDAVSEFQLPLDTKELTIRSVSDMKRIVKVLNAATGEQLPFDVNTGRVSGISDGIRLNLEIGDYFRNNEVTVFVDEELAESNNRIYLALSSGKVMEKLIALQAGYQDLLYNDDDQPLAIISSNAMEEPLSVYLNETKIDLSSESHEFPEKVTPGSIIKIYAGEQTPVHVNYDFSEATELEISVTHDSKTVIANPSKHQVLPGTEIALTVAPKAVVTTPAQRQAALKAETPSFNVIVNEEELAPDNDGTYRIKVSRAHATSGLNIKVAQPKDPTGIDELFGDEKRVDVYNLNGIIVHKSASREDIKRLDAGIYIINGTKFIVR